VIGRLALQSRTIGLLDFTEIELVDDIRNKVGEVTLRQPFLKRGRQKEELVGIVGLVASAHGLTPCFSFILQRIKGLWEEEYSDRLLEG
jgi:hypothetical protein